MSAQIDVTKITPMPGYVLVKPAEEQETKTASGIYLPDSADEKPQHGTVLAVGTSVWESGLKEVKSPVKIKDNVIYKKWGGNDVKIGDVEYQFLKFEDVLAVIK